MEIFLRRITGRGKIIHWINITLSPRETLPECDYCHFKYESITLSHESPDPEPETVEQGEIVLDESGGRVARVGVVPLIGGEPAAQKKQTFEKLPWRSSANMHKHHHRQRKIKKKKSFTWQ